jgi:hypothetical protein
MIIDESMWTDLYDSGYTADYYWKVAQDPAIASMKYHYNWHNSDYIITTPEILTDVQNNHMTLGEDVLVHSTLITCFDIGGRRIEIRKVNK